MSYYFGMGSYIKDIFTFPPIFWPPPSPILAIFLLKIYKQIWKNFDSFSHPNCRRPLWAAPTALCCKSIRSLACFYSKMPMFQRAGMRVEEEPLPLSFQYLILTIWTPCNLNFRLSNFPLFQLYLNMLHHISYTIIWNVNLTTLQK